MGFELGGVKFWVSPLTRVVALNTLVRVCDIGISLQQVSIVNTVAVQNEDAVCWLTVMFNDMHTRKRLAV